MAALRNRTSRSRRATRWWCRELRFHNSRFAAASAVVLLLLVAMSAAGQAQQTSDSGSSAQAVAASDQAPRTYIPSLFGQQPIAVDMWQPAVPSNESAPAVGVVDTSAQDSGAVEPWAPYVRNPAQHYLLYGLNLSANLRATSAYQGLPADFPGSAATRSLSWDSWAAPGPASTCCNMRPASCPMIRSNSRSVTFHNFSFDASRRFHPAPELDIDVNEGYGGEIGPPDQQSEFASRGLGRVRERRQLRYRSSP